MGSLLNQAFDIDTFNFAQEYQVCQILMFSLSNWNKDKYSFLYNSINTYTKIIEENEVSNDSSVIDLTRKVSIEEETILSLFENENSQKAYSDLLISQRIN